MININNTTRNTTVMASLRQVSQAIGQAQTRVGTGYRISSSSEGERDWATAQTIRAGLQRQGASNDAMTLAKARVDAGIAGLDKITDLLTGIADVATHLSPTATGATLAAAQNEIRSYQAQVTTAIHASGFQGRNALTGASESVTIGTTSNGTAVRLSMTGVDISAAGAQFAAAVTGAMTNATSVKTLTDIAAMALAYVASYRDTLAAFSSSIDAQVDFQDRLTSIKQTALGALVDTDMEAESARIAALQARQQLAYQALGISNASPQNILALFV